MDKVKVAPRVYAALLLRNRTPEQRVALGNHIGSSMAGNLSFVTPFPTLLEFAGVTTALNTAIDAAMSGGDVAKAELEVAVNNFDTMAVRMQDYIENVANADPANAGTIILTSGLTLSKTPEKSPIPAAVDRLVASYTYVTGTIETKWKGSKYSRFYRVYQSTTPTVPASWTLAATTTKKTAVIGNLTSNTTYYFYVVAVGVAGASLPSMQANCIAA